MVAELPLSTRILLVLNPSIVNMMTKWSLWGCLTPLASASLKDMDFVSWRNPTVSNSLAWGYDFFMYGHRCGAYHNASDAEVRNKRIQCAKIKNVNDSFLLDIFSITFWGGWGWWSSFLDEDSCWLLWLLRNLLYSFFFTYFCNLPFCISSSTCSFRSLQSSVLWPWFLWNRQYLFLSRTLGDECNGLGHLR